MNVKIADLIGQQDRFGELGDRMLHLSRPIVYTIEIEARCNNACVGCANAFSRYAGDPGEPLALQEWQRLLLQIVDGARLVKMTGGEPTLSPFFFELVDFADKLGIPYVVFTNGRWREPERLVRFLQRKKHLRGLLVSLHGATPDAHNAFTCVESSFVETSDNIRMAAEMLCVVTNTVITQQNCNQLKDILELSACLGAKSANFSRYVGPSVDGLTPTDEQLGMAAVSLQRIRDSGGRASFGPCIPQCFVHSDASGCTAGIASVAVDPWGWVKACTHSPHVAGSIREQSLEEIWTGPSLQAWREMIPADCLGCSALELCRGGCRAQMILTKGTRDPLMCQPLSHQFRQEVELSGYTRPVLVGEIAEEEWGYSLTNRTRVRGVSDQGKNLLQKCDGHLTLYDIRREHGETALMFVAGLWQEGFVDLRMPEEQWMKTVRSYLELENPS